MKTHILGIVMLISLSVCTGPVLAATGTGTFVGFTVDNRYTLTTSSSSGGAVTTPGESSYAHTGGTSVPVVATPQSMYSFVSWTGTAVTAGKVANAASASTIVTMDSDYTLMANFTSQLVFGVMSLHVLEADMADTSAVLRGKIFGNTGQSECWYRFRYFKVSDGFTEGVYTEKQAVTTVNGQGEFSQLLDGLEPNCAYAFQASAGNATDKDMGSYVHFTTLDKTKAQVELTVLASMGGNVLMPGPGTHSYDPMTSVSIAAQADPNHVFLQWTGTAVDANQVADAYAAATTVMMDADYVVQAIYEPNVLYLYVDASAIGNPVQDGKINSPFASIQQAIDSALDGDVVIVQPGTYYGTGNSLLDTQGKQITIRSLMGPESCIIDCQNNERAFHFQHGEDAGTVIDGFTIMGGSGVPGSAVYCEGASPTLANCIIRGNGPNAIWISDQLHIQGTVTVLLGVLEGPGFVQVAQDQRLQTQSCIVRCDILGMGSWVVLSGEPSVLGGTALVDLSWIYPSDGVSGGFATLDDGLFMSLDENPKGWMSLDGRLRIQDQAVLQNMMVESGANGSLEVVDQGSLIDCELNGATDTSLILDAETYAGSLDDSEISVTLDQDQDFEIRGIPYCTDDGTFMCYPGLHLLKPVPALDAQTQTLSRLKLAPGVKVNVVDQYNDQVGAPFNVLYVKELVLGDGAELNLAGQRVYYETFLGSPEQIVGYAIYVNRLVEVSVGDPNTFNNDVTTNNTPDQIFVSLVDDANIAPDPVIYLQDQAGQPARAKAYLGQFSQDEVYVSFSYLFNTNQPGVLLEVYLSDQQGLLPLDDPHMLLMGRIAPPILGCPGSLGSGLFASYTLPVNVGSLDPNQGLWLELILSEPGQIPVTQGFVTMDMVPANVPSPQGGAYAQGLTLASRCLNICMDLTSDGFVSPEDYTLVAAGCGRSVDGSTPQTSPLSCIDRGYSRNGYADISEIVNWADLLGRAGSQDIENLCSIPLVWENMYASANAMARNFSMMVPMADPEAVSYSGLLILGKGSTFLGNMEFMSYADILCGFDSEGASSQAYELPSNQGQMRLVKDGDNALILDSDKGLCQLTGKVIVGAGQRDFEGMTVTLGIEAGGDYPVRGRPLRDASIHDGSVYVVPVIVQDSSGMVFQAGARLSVTDQGYDVEQLYYDRSLVAVSGQSPNLQGLGDIEVDDNGRVYLLNAYNQNDSNMLWVFNHDGTLERRHFLDRLPEPIENPVGLCYDTNSGRIYLASGVFDMAKPSQSIVYGYRIETLLSERPLETIHEITIDHLQHVTGLTCDGRGTLWVTGVELTRTPESLSPEHLYAEYTLPLPRPHLAQVDTSDGGADHIDAINLHNTMTINLPTSIVWVGQ